MDLAFRDWVCVSKAKKEFCLNGYSFYFVHLWLTVGFFKPQPFPSLCFYLYKSFDWVGFDCHKCISFVSLQSLQMGSLYILGPNLCPRTSIWFWWLYSTFRDKMGMVVLFIQTNVTMFCGEVIIVMISVLLTLWGKSFRLTNY